MICLDCSWICVCRGGDQAIDFWALSDEGVKRFLAIYKEQTETMGK